jgi:hypothetical protein
MRAPTTTTAGDWTVPKVRTMSGKGAFSALATLTGIGPGSPLPRPFDDDALSCAPASVDTKAVSLPAVCQAFLVWAGNSTAAAARQATATSGMARRALSIGKFRWGAPCLAAAAPSHQVRNLPSASSL